MIVNVKILAGGISERTVDLEDGGTFKDILVTLSLNPETVIPIVDGRPVPVDEVVSSDRLDILKIVSGG